MNLKAAYLFNYTLVFDVKHLSTLPGLYKQNKTKVNNDFLKQIIRFMAPILFPCTLLLYKN